jgi:two-component system, cell cycle sensor histidine kinase and response regulator CckA
MFGLFNKRDNFFDNFFDNCPIPLLEIDISGNILFVNQAFGKIMRGKELRKTFVDYLSEAEKPIFTKLLNDKNINPETSQSFALQLDGVELIISLSVMRLNIEGDLQRIFIFINDVTEQKNLEMRFAHSQKMQAVGQLAGGIAHDFNNLLTAMIGFCDLLLMRHPAGDPSFADLIQIKQNSNRAANLVRQLLAFSRRQTLQPKRVDLVDLIAELSNLIRRLIGENIELKINHARNLWEIKADQGQLEQVLINLAVNARDAMKNGGNLTIQTSNLNVNNNFDKTLRIPPQEYEPSNGDYVVIEVKDSGTGISDSVIDNIFEPFFSTKEVGSGTGLGLSTVYGIVKQTGGYIYLKTEENIGTSFYIYLPKMLEADDKTLVNITSHGNESQDLTGAATIMLVEDESPVRMFAVRALQNKGYQVIEADCGEGGVEIFASNKDKIEVIVTDVVMPGINGPTMIEKLDKAFPDEMNKVKVLFMSGYAEDAFASGFGDKREFNFLAKPFTLKQLAAKLKEITKAAD